MTEKFKSKYNSATAEKALPVGKQPAQQQPDAACQPGNEWVFRYELRYPSSCGPSLPAFILTSASQSEILRTDLSQRSRSEPRSPRSFERKLDLLTMGNCAEPKWPTGSVHLS